jgi:exocyst complex component 7
MGHFDVVQSEEPLILNGPNVENINPYLDTMDRVLKGLQYLQRSDLQSQQSVLLKMYDLIEIGSIKLSEIISDWITAESNPIDISDYISSTSTSNHREFPTLSSATYSAITPILSYLKSLPNHPSTGFSPFLHGLSTLSDIRSDYLDSSISPLGAKVLEYAIERMGSENGAGGMAGMTSAFGLMSNDDDDGANVAGHRRGNAGAEAWIEGMVLMAEVSLLRERANF